MSILKGGGGRAGAGCFLRQPGWDCEGWRCTDLQAERVSMEAISERREVRWMETMDSCLVSLGLRGVVSLDRRPEQKANENGNI